MLSFYRRIVPSQREDADRDISEDAHAIDQRKIRVNAQVKAMISLLELSSNIGYVIIISFTVRTSYATLVQFMFLYMVLLPYAFLMNTSHNKNRIVEYGWTNVCSNLIMKLNSSGTHDTNNDNANRAVYNISLNFQDKHVPVPNKVICNSSQKHDIERIQTDRVESSITPSSSKRTSIPMILDANLKVLPHECQSNNLIEKTFIRKMRKHIDDEMKYLESFKDFISFQEHCKEDQDLGEFKAGCEIQYYSSKNIESGNPTTNRKIKSSGLIEPKTLLTSKNVEFNNVDKETSAISDENKRSKREKRIHLLECLKICSEQNLSFDFFKEQLISLEESLINC